MSSSSHAFLRRLMPFLAVLVLCLAWSGGAQAQSFRFNLRAEPDVIPANGISTTSIFVQVPQGRGAISASPTVRFATTAGVIETTAQLSGGVARVLLRSANTPGTAVVTAFIGSSREALTVEFSEENGIAQRYLEISAPYVAYGADSSQITASGKTGLDFGDTHIESDVRLDVDLYTERVWAQGTKGSVIIRHGRGPKAKELRGDRLFYDLRRRRGVIRRAEGTQNGEAARQEFVGSNFAPPPSAEATAENEEDPELNRPNLTNSRPKDSGSSETTKPNVKPPLSPSPQIQLENEANRGSTFVLPNTPPPTAPETAESTTAPAIIPPQTLGDLNNETAKNAETAPAVDAVVVAPEGVTNAPIGPSTVAPGSLADTPKAPEGAESRVTSLVTVPRPAPEGESGPPNVPAYSTLPSDAGPTPLIVELPPPVINAAAGYWVTARRLRVFPRDKVQFERASIFFNGKKAYGVPIYVLPLDGSFNPTTDMLSFNSEGGLSLKVPFYYQASKVGTGAVYLKREPGGGFSSQPSGLSLALDQQYWLSPRSHGSVSLDQLGRGAWNLNFQHQTQLSPNTTGSFYLSMPRHRDMFARASLAKDLRAMQVGFEAFYDRPEDSYDNLRTQFYARSRPKSVGKTGWNYTLGANALAVRRTLHTVTEGSGGGGVGIPGGGTGGTTYTTTRPLYGQTVTASFQSPLYSPWRGSGFSANLLTTAFNYSDGRRGLAPGATLGYTQKFGRADIRLDYTYNRANVGLYGLTGDSFTHYVSGSVSAQLTSKIGLSTFLSKSLADSSAYGSADLSYYFSPKWRTGLFADYTSFTGLDSPFTYGWSLGRMIGTREISLNYDTNRGRVYVELGNARY